MFVFLGDTSRRILAPTRRSSRINLLVHSSVSDATCNIEETSRASSRRQSPSRYYSLPLQLTATVGHNKESSHGFLESGLRHVFVDFPTNAKATRLIAVQHTTVDTSLMVARATAINRTTAIPATAGGNTTRRLMARKGEQTAEAFWAVLRVEVKARDQKYERPASISSMSYSFGALEYIRKRHSSTCNCPASP